MRILYITAFTVLGIIVQFLFHAAIEIWAIRFFTETVDPVAWGISWSMLFAVHHMSAVLFFIGGAYVGFREGRYWWRELYVKRNSGLWKIGKKVKGL